MTGSALIYGATGYIGALCARRAAAAGLRPVLADRNAEALAALGDELGVPTRAFGLDHPAATGTALTGIAVVLNCAGSFHRTATPHQGVSGHGQHLHGSCGIPRAVHVHVPVARTRGGR